MPNSKISALTSATTPLAGTEVLPIVQSNTTVKVATDDLTVKNVRSNATTGILQIVGPGAGTTRTMTTPNANFTVARTDAGQTFTGTQIMTSPQILTGINDTNGNELVLFTATASAVNELTIANAATGNRPTISATGGDTNISINLTPKGTGDVRVTTGNLVMATAGNGIDFSATASGTGTMTSELLADYEEGTFTPTLEGNSSSSGNVYSTQVGTYIKVGSVVVCTIALTVSTWGTNTGIATFIKGLPFTTNSSGYPFTIVGWSNLNANYVIVQAYADPSDTKLVLTGATAASASSIGFVPPIDIKNSTTLYLVFTYRSA